MAQKWTAVHVGKPANGGIENWSTRTGFAEAELPFGRPVQYSTAANKEGIVTDLTAVGASSAFAGFAVFSQEATGFTKTHTGPTARYAVHPEKYLAGDVVGVLDAGSIIVKVESAVAAGDVIAIDATGKIVAAKSIAEVTAGAKTALILNAVAESTANSGECIGITLYSPAFNVRKYN